MIAVKHSEGPTQQDLFVAGSGGYHTYRIPSLLALPTGVVLAFCEGRKDSRSDTGEIHTLLRRSTDGGLTWDEPRVVAADNGHTVGNPCAVPDTLRGTVHLLLTRNLGNDTEEAILAGTSRGTREVLVLTSNDQGTTWTPPRTISDAARRENWTWYATGPGVGVQLRSGRLLVPCDHAVAGTREFYSHALLSDDGGATWRIGGVAGPRTNECQAAELPDGTVLLAMRSYHGCHRRAVSRSPDGGVSWSPPVLDDSLVEPVCQAGLVAAKRPGGEFTLLFTNPAAEKRERLTIRLGTADGSRWPHARLLHAGPSAYSCPAMLPDGTILSLYECGKQHPYECLRLARFSTGWLQGGAAEA